MKRFLEKGAPILIIIILCILVLVWALGGFLAGTFAGGSVLIGECFSDRSCRYSCSDCHTGEANQRDRR